MPKLTVEKYKEELEDKVKELLRKREEMILEADKLNKDLQALLEQQLALDETKIRIYCLPPPLGCNGKGYIESDGKKQFCPMCGGPEKPYIWASRYEEPKK